MFLTYTRYVIVILTGVLLFSVSAAAEVIGLKIEPHSSDPNRLFVHIDALIEDVPGQIDRRLDGYFDGIRSCSKRPFRVGNTSIRSGGQHLDLRSTVRYEQWLCAIIKTRLARSTHPVEWRLDVTNGSRIDNLLATATVTNIRDLPDTLEEILDLRISFNVPIPIPVNCDNCFCEALVDKLVPMPEHIVFQPNNSGRDVLVKATFSAPRDLSFLSQCF